MDIVSDGAARMFECKHSRYTCCTKGRLPWLNCPGCPDFEPGSIITDEDFMKPENQNKTLMQIMKEKVKEERGT